MKSCVSRTDSLITQTFASGARCVVDTGTARQNVEAARSLYLESSNIGLPPYECRDVAERFADVMALADNAFIYADPTRKDDFPDAAGEFLLETTLRDYRRNLERLRYEIEKVT